MAKPTDKVRITLTRSQWSAILANLAHPAAKPIADKIRKEVK